MGNDISPGLTLVDGQWVHDADLNALVGEATILPTAISARSLMSALSSGAEFLVNDAGTLRKATTQQIVSITQLPAGVMMDYAGTTEPLGWMFCYGQLISRTTYAELFAAIGIAYGAGDGSTTFAVPDFRGRIAGGRDDMGGTAANRLVTAVSGVDGKTLGAVGGNPGSSITVAELPSHTHAGVDHLHPVTGVDHLHYMDHSHNLTNHVHTYNEIIGLGGGWGPTGNGWRLQNQTTGGMTGATNTGNATTPYTGAADRSLATNTGAADRPLTTGATGSGTLRTNTQPTIITNKIIKT